MHKTLYLIDGHAQIFRAYYAIRGGMNSPVTGEPTQAVFGFAGMLLKLLQQFHPSYVVVAIDLPGKTFRDELYDQYKANREPPPADFGPQVERILQMTRMFGIPIISMPGAEADDVIATCVQRILDEPEHGDVDVRIVSKDKDLEQLLTDRVTMFDIHTDKSIDVAALMESKGITPEQVVEVLALMGDKVDNIPGVEGVGPKTAAKLIGEYHSIEGIYANLDKIKGKRKDNLEQARSILDRSVQLVQLKRDLDLNFDLEAAQVGAVDAIALRRFFKEMGFRRHLVDLERLLPRAEKTVDGPQCAEHLFATSLFDGGAAATTDEDAEQPATNLATAVTSNYRAVTTREQLDELLDVLRRQPMVSVDAETIGLGHRAELCGLCFAWKAGEGVYVPMRSPDPSQHLDAKAVLETVRDLLEDPDVPKCGHNLKYDLLVLAHAGIKLAGVAFDSMIASHLLDHPGHGLDHLALAQLQYETIPISSLIRPRSEDGLTESQERTMDQVPLEQITPYAAEDADIALRLYELFQPQLKEQGLANLAADVEMPLVEVLAQMQSLGIRLDPDELDRQRIRLTAQIKVLRQEVMDRTKCSFNLDSPKQLAEVLFTHLGLPVIKRTKTGPSTDVEVLERLRDREDLDPEQAAVPGLVVEYRQLTKLVNTYLGNLRESINADTGRVHASFHQTGAATGRLSSSGPNLQNIPIRTDVGRQVRKAFVAEPGQRLISADYSQIELRLLAHLSQDPALMDAFARDQDIHQAVAAQVFNVEPDEVTGEQRARAKVINFGIIYGITAFGLARRIDGLGRTQAQELIDSYRSHFAGIDTFLQACVAQADKLGYVTTILGRRRAIDQIKSTNAQTRALGERLAINSVVQGSAADLIKLAMVNLHRRIQADRLPLRILLQIHDELVCEAPAEAADEQALIVCHEMEHAMELSVPLKVDSGIGADWFTVKS
jgi:DNA polymerase-1